MTENVMMKPRTRVMWTAAERAEWLAPFEHSGQSVAEFCRQNDLSPATLYFWLRQQQGPAGGEDGALVEVPNGLRLQVPVGADIAWLSALLQTVAKV